jgi:WD40 repeat protein
VTVAAEAPAPAPADGAAGGQVDQDNPWPGLPSFREQDQEFFFGREAETETLRRTVMRESTRATVLFGRSGLGKTSLLQAGLFPRLRRQGVLPVAIRLVYAGERGLVEQVRDAILAAAAAARVEAPAFPADETLWESFHRAAANFWNESNRIVVPLLVFDQFEEIFTLGKQDPAVREAFLAELADLVEGRPPAAVKARLDAEPALAAGFSPERHDYKILLSLRQDFLADLDGLRGRMRSLGASRLALLHMNGEAALRVVTRAGGHLIEPDVAERVVRFVSGAGRQSAAGAGEAGAPAPLAELEVDPTLLSLVCRELNNRRRERGQPQITFDLLSGSWKEILTRFYEHSLDGLAPAVRTFVEERLLTRSGYRDSVAWDNAIAEPGVTAADLLALRDRRLLRFEERHGTAWIELTHDVLTEVIGESRELRRQRDARLQAELALREADERARQAGEREREAQDRERETRRLLARSRKLAVVLGAVLLAAVALSVLGAWLWRRSEAAERRAERALLDSAGNLIEKGRGAQALAYLASIMRSSPQDSSIARSRTLDSLLHEGWPLPVRVVRHERAVTNAELSPDGERLFTASADGTARLWRVRDGVNLGVMRGDKGSWAAFSSDGTRVLTAAVDGVMRIWDGRNGAPVGREMKDASPLFGARWSPRGDRIVTSSLKGVGLWDPASQKPLPVRLPGGAFTFSPDGTQLLLKTLHGNPRWFDLSTGAGAGELPLAALSGYLLIFSHRGDRLLSVDFPGTVRIWDVAAHRLVSTYEHKLSVTGAEFSPDDHTLLTMSADRAVRLWNLDDPGQPARVLQHDKAVIAAHFSPDGRWVLTGSRDGAARLWNARLGEIHAQPLLHAAPLEAIGFSRDGRWAVTAADDGAAKVWELRADDYARPLQLPQPVRFAFFGAQGRDVLASMRDGTARRWDLATGASTPLAPANRQPRSVTVLTDGRLATIAIDEVRKTVQVWDGTTGKPMSVALHFDDIRLGIPSVTADGRRVLWLDMAGLGSWDARTGTRVALVPYEGGAMSLTADGRLVLTSSPTGVRIWETGTGRKVGEIVQDHTTWAVFGADDRLVVVSAADNLLRLFATPGGRRAAPPLPFAGFLRGVDFSHDGARMVTTSWSGEAKVSDVESGRVLCQWLMPPAGPADTELGFSWFSASISADGRRLLAFSPEGLAQIWDVESCRQLSEPLWQPPPSRVTYTRFSPDGSRAITLDDQGIARVWDLPEAAAADSEPLADLAEAVGGYAVDQAGNAVPVQDQVAHLDRLRARAARPVNEPALALRVLRWFFAEPAARTLSPFSAIKAPAAANPQ